VDTNTCCLPCCSDFHSTGAPEVRFASSGSQDAGRRVLGVGAVRRRVRGQDHADCHHLLHHGGHRRFDVWLRRRHLRYYTPPASFSFHPSFYLFHSMHVFVVCTSRISCAGFIESCEILLPWRERERRSMDRVLHAWIICFASLACLSSSFWTQADKHRLQTKLMGGFTVAIKHVPLINGRLEDFPALLHLPIHSEYFPFFFKKELFSFIDYIVPKNLKNKRGSPSLHHHY